VVRGQPSCGFCFSHDFSSGFSDHFGVNDGFGLIEFSALNTFHAAPAPAVGDPALLERVAGNLLENAVRHNIDGGWIDVRTSATPEWATLRVSSSGVRIDAGHVSELFEPFRRGGVDRTAQSGTGLGLSIVRAVVIAHHGQVTAAPVPDGGLSVTVHLPAKP